METFKREAQICRIFLETERREERGKNNRGTGDEKIEKDGRKEEKKEKEK